MCNLFLQLFEADNCRRTAEEPSIYNHIDLKLFSERRSWNHYPKLMFKPCWHMIRLDKLAIAFFFGKRPRIR